MRVYVILNADNFIDSWTFEQIFDNQLEISLDREIDLTNLQCYKYENNTLVYSQERENELKTKYEEYKKEPNPPSEMDSLKDTDTFLITQLMQTQVELREAHKANAELTLQLVMKGVI